MSISKRILKNNIVLVTEPIATCKTVAIGFWFSAGSRYEAENESGIAHFVEHLLFKGTPTQKSYDIARSFDRIGGYVNAYTEREQICLHCVVPAGYATFALQILTDMTQNSLFLQSEIDKERSVIESEIISAADDPEEACMDTVAETVWPSNSISKNICGNVESVKKFSASQLKDWYTKYIVNGELVAVISGNFDETEVQKILEKLPTKKTATTAPASEFTFPLWQNGIHYKESDFQQEQVLLLFPLQINDFSKNYYAFAVLNALIGDTMSSRLFQTLRENSGYCYNVYSFYSLFSDTGFWASYASSSKNDVVQLIKKLYSEIKSVFANGITDDELVAAKEHLCGEEIINSEDVENRMKRLYRLYSFDFEMEEYDDTILKIRSISKSDVESAVKKLVDWSKKSLVIYGPRLSKKHKKEIENVFKCE